MARNHEELKEALSQPGVTRTQIGAALAEYAAATGATALQLVDAVVGVLRECDGKEG